MKVASFNINCLCSRLPVILLWLTEQQLDVLCLQETKVQDIDFRQVSLRQEDTNASLKAKRAITAGQFSAEVGFQTWSLVSTMNRRTRPG